MAGGPVHRHSVDRRSACSCCRPGRTYIRKNRRMPQRRAVEQLRNLHKCFSRLACLEPDWSVQDHAIIPSLRMLSARGGVSVQPTNIESCYGLRWDLNYNPHLCVRPRPSTVRPNGLDSYTPISSRPHRDGNSEPAFYPCHPRFRRSRTPEPLTHPHS